MALQPVTDAEVKEVLDNARTKGQYKRDLTDFLAGDAHAAKITPNEQGEPKVTSIRSGLQSALESLQKENPALGNPVEFRTYENAVFIIRRDSAAVAGDTTPDEPAEQVAEEVAA